MKKGKTLLIIAILITLLSCTSGSSSDNSKDKNSNVSFAYPAKDPTKTYNEDGAISWRDSNLSYNKNDPHNMGNAILTGKGVKVGVIDTGFNTEGSDLKADMVNKFDGRLIHIPSPNKTGNDKNHGIAVSEVIGGNTNIGIAKGVTIYGYDTSKLENEKILLDPNSILDALNIMYDNYGIRIFNQSFGSEYTLNSSQPSPIPCKEKEPNCRISDDPNDENYYKKYGENYHSGFYKKAVEGGALFISSAGNDDNSGRKNEEKHKIKNIVILPGALPHFEPWLEKGWINVVGLKTDDWSTNLSWNSNLDVYTRAGVAKNWTVTAIGTKEYSINGKKPKTIQGSSFAAPTVTGTAALIKQKYPWMDGNLIRQTILSTATDIGPEGVDDVFGWGLLNIEKATNGPALFDKRLALGDDVVVNVTPGTYTFSNDIGGDATLYKKGSGKLILSGNSTFPYFRLGDGTLVINGKTHTSGTLTAGTLELGRRASLTDIDNQGGTFVNTGNGTLENYTGSPNSTYASALGAELNVNGNVNLNDSKLRLLNEKDGNLTYITKNGVTNNIISAKGNISGNFKEVQTEEMLNGNIVEQDSSSVKTKLSRKNVSDYVKNLDISDEMRNNVSENLETAFSELDKEVENGNVKNNLNFSNKAALLQTMSARTASPILDSLSGQIYASAQALTFQHSQTINKDLSNRLVMLGTLDNTGDKFGLWVSGIGANGKLKQNGYGEGKTKVYGGQAGIDKKFGENLILGTALSYSTANVKFDRYGGESDADNFGISLYGRLGNKNNPLYLQGRVGLGFVQSDVDRDIILSSTDRTRTSINHNDKVYSGYLETGYDVKKGNFVITPFVGISHDTVQRGSFDEDNSQFGLKADKKTYKQTNGLIGLRASQGFNWGKNSKTTIQGYVTHQKAFNKEDLSYDAKYTGLQNATFKVKGIGLSKSKTWAGVGVLTEFNPNFSWYANYDKKIENDSKGKGNNNVFTTGVRVNIN